VGAGPARRRHFSFRTGQPRSQNRRARRAYRARTHLLKDLSEAGIILDFTQLADEAFSPVLEIFDGLIGASQRSCRASVRGDRHFSGELHRYLIQRDAVIGGVLDIGTLYPKFVAGGTAEQWRLAWKKWPTTSITSPNRTRVTLLWAEISTISRAPSKRRRTSTQSLTSRNFRGSLGRAAIRN